MHGNVWQWCMDYVGGHDPLKNTDPVRLDKGAGDFRMMRGGGYGNSATDCRVIARSFKAPSGRNRDLGIRVAVSIQVPK